MTEVAAYVVDGNHVTPTDQARGPWFADQQHGASILGLLTRFLERVPSHQPMRLTRITADLSRPVPMKPCTVTARALRDGRRVQSLEAIITCDDTIVSRAVATRIRTEPGLVPESSLPPLYPGDEAPALSGEIIEFSMPHPTFHDCLEIRLLDQDGLGNSKTWFRLAHPLVAGETPSPAVRLGSTADMIMSSAMALGPGWVSINPEVSLQIERDPVGEWICVDSTVRFTQDGIGTSEGVLYDQTRRIGRSAKSILNYRA